jgi:phosphoserine phosphatase RsbU/P
VDTQLLGSPETHFQALEEEIQSLRQEVQLLRRRDEMVHFYLHKLDEELRLASRLQRDFLPKVMPEVDPIRFHTLFRPAGYVSGDLYDVFQLDESHMGFYLADAIGHGVPAALLTMFLRTSLVTKEIDANGYRILAPGEAMERLNTSLMQQNFSQTTFATAVYGVIDVKSMEVSFARAGHPCPVLLRDGKAELIQHNEQAVGGLLGVFPGEKYPTSSHLLLPGDRFFIHSDGMDAAFVSEEINSGKQWCVELSKQGKLETSQILSQLSSTLDKQAGSLRPKDDLTIIALEVQSKP